MELRPERLERIVQLLKQRGGVRTNELAEELGVSAATVRRDLEDLAARGLVDRAHGGAVILRSGTDKEAPFAERAQRMRAEKERIARRALDFVPDGATAILDSGTTVLELARRLAGRSMTAIALDLPSAKALSAEEGVEVWTPGGRVRNGRPAGSGRGRSIHCARLRSTRSSWGLMESTPLVCRIARWKRRGSSGLRSDRHGPRSFRPTARNSGGDRSHACVH